MSFWWTILNFHVESLTHKIYLFHNELLGNFQKQNTENIQRFICKTLQAALYIIIFIRAIFPYRVACQEIFFDCCNNYRNTRPHAEINTIIITTIHTYMLPSLHHTDYEFSWKWKMHKMRIKEHLFSSRRIKNPFLGIFLRSFRYLVCILRMMHLSTIHVYATLFF